MAVVIGVVAAVAVVPARAADLDLQWHAPRDCPDGEALRSGLSRRLGREVTIGPDASLSLAASIAARDDGYVLELEAHSPDGSEQRQLQARSCGELARASLLIAAVLLSAGPAGSRLAAAGEGDAAAHEDDPSGPGWFLIARARAVADLGSLGGASLGPGLAVGLGLHRTRIELGALLLPPQALPRRVLDRAPGSLRLMAASAELCHELFDGPTLAPCLHLELGRLSGRGENLDESGETAAAWLTPGLGLRAGLRLFGSMYGYADLRGGVPLIRPRFAVRGVGLVHQVPEVIGRLELSVEGRL